jgi:hypothetical protein
MRGCWLALLVVAAGCGGSHSTSGPSPVPTPTPAPVAITVTASLTNTVTGAPVGTQTTTVTTLPARLTITQAGFLTRELTVTSTTPTVDLIPDGAPFDLAFYRQLTRGALDGEWQNAADARHDASRSTSRPQGCPRRISPHSRKRREPVPLLSGDKFTVGVFDTGSSRLVAEAGGWFVVELVNDDGNALRALSRWRSGRSRLAEHRIARCGDGLGNVIDPVFWRTKLVTRSASRTSTRPAR